MKVLMISTDRKILEKNSEVRQRMIEYGELTNELHIIVFNKYNANNANVIPIVRIANNVFVYPTNSGNKWLYVRDAVKIGEEIIRKLKVESRWLITAQDPFECGLVGYRIAKKFRIPLQLQIHTDFLNPYFKKESLLNRARVLIAKFLIPRANCIRVVSERIKKSLKTINYKLKTEITVLPVFVDIQKIQETPVKTDLRQKYPQFNFIILMASRLTKEKNIGLAMETIDYIVKKYPKTGLIIVGDGLEEKKLKGQSSKIKDNVIFEPWSDDLISYYKTCGAFLLTSNYEGYGRTVVEAIASRCPVIMTDVGIAGEIAKDKYNSLIIPVGDKLALEHAIEKMINDRALRASISLSSENIVYKMPSKNEYLKMLKKSWENCL